MVNFGKCISWTTHYYTDLLEEIKNKLHLGDKYAAT